MFYAIGKNLCLLLAMFLILPNSLYAIDKSQIEYVLSKYQHTIKNRECLFYPARNPKRLLILFTGLKKNTYILWSWFWREREDWDDTAYLFLKDDDGCWYLGNHEASFIDDYTSMINHFMSLSGVKNDQVFTIGGSMGGYAAIFYATKLGLRAAIAINPQVTREAQAIRSQRISPVRTFKEIGDKWQDLEKVVAASSYAPDISLIYSRCLRDQAAGNILLDVLKEKGALVILRRHESYEHSGGANLTKEFIEDEISYFEKQNQYKMTIKSF